MRNSQLHGLGRITRGALRVARAILAEGNRSRSRAALAALLTAALNLKAQTILTTGHTDVGLVYEDDAWNLHVGRHDDSPPAEYAPNEAILQVGPASKTSVPASPAFSFLGEPGAPIYVLPEVQNPALLFLGLGTEELPSGLFTNDQVRLHLKSVTGPGQFFLYEVSPLGTPTVFMNSQDGIASNDVVTLTAGGHRHVNWAFSTPGTYQVDLEASGTLASNNQFTASGPVTYTFTVLPTPLLAGHTDVGLVYEDDAWNLHIGRHDDIPPMEYAPGEAILQVAPASKTSVPANPAFGFLGEPGAPIFVLPEVENPALLFLGLGTEELPSGLFTNDQVQLYLKGVTGPGQFFVYEVSPLGTPTVFMNSQDGIASNDVVTLTAGGHRHVNWAFSTPGTYQVDLEASGTLASNNQFTASGPVTYTFKVLAPSLLSGHTDVGLVYEDDAWNLHIGRHDDIPPMEYAPNEAILQVGPASKTSIPANPAFGFLGEPGAPIFVLPEVQNPALLFLGLGTEELPSGLFTNDQVQLYLKGVTGPGQFFLYEVSPLGTPTVFMNSRDGIASNDVVTLTAGGHRHVNWAFSTPGTYQVDFEASGTLASNAQFTASGPVTYTFKVLGESPTLGISPISNGVQLDWPSALDVNYQIQSRLSIGTGEWTDWGEPTPGTGAPLSIPVTQSSGNEFFRVRLE